MFKLNFRSCTMIHKSNIVCELQTADYTLNTWLWASKENLANLIWFQRLTLNLPLTPRPTKCSYSRTDIKSSSFNSFSFIKSGHLALSVDNVSWFLIVSHTNAYRAFLFCKNIYVGIQRWHAKDKNGDPCSRHCYFHFLLVKQ